MPRRFKALFVFILLVMFGNTITLYYYTSILMDKEAWVSHTFKVMAEIESLRAELKTAGISIRNLLLTDEDAYTPGFYVARDKLQSDLDSLARLTVDNSTQQDRIARLRPMIESRIKALNHVFKLQQSGSRDEAIRYFRQNYIPDEVKPTDALMDDMIQEESRLLDLRSRQSRRNLLILNGLVSIILLLDVVFVAMIYQVFSRYLTYRRQSEQRFRAIFDQAAVGIDEINAQGFIMNCNPKFCQILGFPSEELIGRNWKDIVHPDDSTESEKLHDRLFAGEIQTYSLEKRYIRKDQTTVWVSVTTSAVRQDGDHTDFRLSIVQDISERKAAELEIEKLLHESQVANRLKEEFLLTVSHELRTPLNLVIGHAELLEYEEPGTQDFHSSLEGIRKGAKAQLKLVNELLDITAMSSGKIKLDMNRVDLNEVLRTAVTTSSQQFRQKGVQLIFQPPPDPTWIRGDDVRLQEIFWNLLANALEFTAKSDRVMVELQSGSRGAMVRISDTGKGMDPAFLPHAFDQFRQEDGSITRQHGGLGLGLTIARKLVELHGGTLDAASPGRSYGSTFTAFFPMMTEESPSAYPDAHPLTARIPHDLLEARSVLVVEDEHEARSLFAMSLKMAGASVEAVGESAEGFDLLQKKKFDAIISDISLPHENGYEFMKRIRAYERNHNKTRTPAIALTAHVEPAAQKEALDAGFDIHVAKPVRPHEIVEKLSELLRPDPRTL